jgi:hypothetical protein
MQEKAREREKGRQTDKDVCIEKEQIPRDVRKRSGQEKARLRERERERESDEKVCVCVCESE